MPAAALEVDGLSSGYGPTRIVDAVSFTVPAGRRVAVLGRNGVGKTTLLATIAGQVRRIGGTVRLGGVALTHLSGSARARHGLGFVPQARCVFPSLTVEENLVAGLKGRPRGALDEAYMLFPALRERRRNLGAHLSGGEAQMLAVARGILGRPTLLMLDEPLEGLAPAVCEALMAVLAEFAGRGESTILLVEQRIGAALRFADEVIMLERGRIAWTGTPAELVAQPATVDRLLGVGGGVARAPGAG